MRVGSVESGAVRFEPDAARSTDIQRVIVTVSLSAGAEAILRAREYADEIGATFVERDRTGLSRLMVRHSAQRCLVVDQCGLSLTALSGATYRYHPNLGFVRALNFLRGRRDLFIDAAAIAPGERILDCTAGFCSEALLASLATGKSGTVTALESIPELALVTRDGLRNVVLSPDEMTTALRRIHLACSDSATYLASCSAGDYHIICFDPFFSKRLKGSEATVDPLFDFGDKRPLNIDAVEAAMRIASRRVVVKHPVHEELPGRLAAARTEIVSARNGSIAYSVFAKR